MVTTLSGEHTGGGERDRGEKEIPRSRPSRNSTEGVSEVVHGPFSADLSVSDQPLVRRWEGIARMRALGSQPPPPAPGWRAEVRTSHTRNPARHIATACRAHISSAPCEAPSP